MSGNTKQRVISQPWNKKLGSLLINNILRYNTTTNEKSSAEFIHHILDSTTLVEVHILGPELQLVLV